MNKHLKKAAAFLAVFVFATSVVWLVRFFDTPFFTPDASTTRPGRAASALRPLTDAAALTSLIPADETASAHPVERATATGTVLDSRLTITERANIWLRSRLIQTSVQPRPVVVHERWEIDRHRQHAVCLDREMFLADQLIVRTQPGVTDSSLRAALAPLGVTLHERITETLVTVRLSRADLDAVPDATRLIEAQPFAVSSEPDGVGFGSGIPNDPFFTSQWGSHNTGQNGGTPDADMNAPEFWDIVGSTPGIVIAVLDSGLNFAHPDLQNTAWTNPGEIAGDGIDNDASGKIDDLTGWDFVNNDNDPTDDHGHGSNVSGIMVATRNNNIGTAGLLSGARILTCKILNSSNAGTTSNLIAATTYARQRGVKVMNLSLQNYPYSSVLDSEFTACASADVLLVICAGNQGVNNDTTPNYPSCYPHTNIIAVGNHDRTDARWSGAAASNYGFTSVDLFAPGREILAPNTTNGYSSYTGTSQATPHVTAVCAAIRWAHPAFTYGEVKNAVLNSVTLKAAYTGLCTTGGRLNAVTALGRSFRHAPDADTDGDQFSNLFEYLAGSRIDSAGSLPALNTDISGVYFRINLTRIPRAEGYFKVETSSDLLTWTTTGLADFSTAENLLVGMRTDTGSPRGFLRIIAQPAP